MKKNTTPFFHLLILLFPIFFLTLRGWVNTILVISCIVAIFFIFKSNRSAESSTQPLQKTDQFLIAACFSMPFIAIGLGQLFRLEFIARDYDGPVRMLLAFIIFTALSKTQRHTTVTQLLFEYSIPASLYLTLIVSLIQPYKAWNGADIERLTTYFVDPLTFGSMCLALATMSLVSIDLFKKDIRLLRLFKFGAVAAGIYLSIRSGSRTGWIGFPLIIFLLFYIRFHTYLSIRKICALIFFICTCLVLAYIYSPVIQSRIDITFAELVSYQWQGENSDKSSVGVRLSLLRMAAFYFLENPLGGWGDTGFLKHTANLSQIFLYTTESNRQFASTAGFHNEIAANMVRSGIWGLIAIIGVFAIPLRFFFRYLKSSHIEQRGLAIIGIGYVLSSLVNGMTTEVFNLKYLVSFYAFIVAVLLGSIFRLDQSRASPK